MWLSFRQPVLLVKGPPAHEPLQPPAMHSRFQATGAWPSPCSNMLQTLQNNLLWLSIVEGDQGGSGCFLFSILDTLTRVGRSLGWVFQGKLHIKFADKQTRCFEFGCRLLILLEPGWPERDRLSSSSRGPLAALFLEALRNAEGSAGLPLRPVGS